MKGSNSDKDVDFIGPKLMSRQGKLSSSTWKSVISSGFLFLINFSSFKCIIKNNLV